MYAAFNLKIEWSIDCLYSNFEQYKNNGLKRKELIKSEIGDDLKNT